MNDFKINLMFIETVINLFILQLFTGTVNNKHVKRVYIKTSLIVYREKIKIVRAAARQNQKMACAHIEDLDQPRHPQSDQSIRCTLNE